MRLFPPMCACLIYLAACGNGGGGSTEPHHTEAPDTVSVVFLSPPLNQTITLDTFRISVQATSKKGGPYYYFVNLEGFTYPDSTKNSVLYVVGGPMSNGTHCVTARAKN